MVFENTKVSDFEFVEQHRAVWFARPELRSVYHDFFKQLSDAVKDKHTILELGAGPGFLREYLPRVIASDVIATPYVDLVCDGCSLPFGKESIEAIVMLDVLHHLPHPLDFMRETARVLAPGGLAVMIEPWITPASYVMYRYFHHEDCTLNVQIQAPFDSVGKQAFDGNATIPYKLVKYYSEQVEPPLRLVKRQPFLGLPYLATLGFKRKSPLPPQFTRVATVAERLLGPIGRLNATRALLVWEKPR